MTPAPENGTPRMGHLSARQNKRAGGAQIHIGEPF